MENRDLDGILAIRLLYENERAASQPLLRDFQMVVVGNENENNVGFEVIVPAVIGRIVDVDVLNLLLSLLAFYVILELFIEIANPLCLFVKAFAAGAHWNLGDEFLERFFIRDQKPECLSIHPLPQFRPIAIDKGVSGPDTNAVHLLGATAADIHESVEGTVAVRVVAQKLGERFIHSVT